MNVKTMWYRNNKSPTRVPSVSMVQAVTVLGGKTQVFDTHPFGVPAVRCGVLH